MRKIKFRGRRSCDKEWIYGSLLSDNSGDFHILESDVVEKDGHHIHIDSDSPMFFDNDTVGQFTGLHDKNGVEIYEGDILRADGYWNIVIEFENGSFMCKALDKIQYVNKTINVTINNFDLLRLYEVIGNIHEVE